MEWNVYYYSCKSRKIEPLNVFDHVRFMADVKKHIKTCKTRNELEEALKHEAMYYYWSKCEWEILLKPLPNSSDETIKIDIYDQLKMNWDPFVDYVWEKGRKKK